MKLLREKSGTSRQSWMRAGSRWAVLAVGLAAGTPGLSAAEPGPGAGPRAAAPQEQALFDGRSLAGWKKTEFYGAGAVAVQPDFADGRAAIVFEKGDFLTGVNREDEKALPRTNYEITLEAMKVAGGDFFCGLTFPVGESACSFIVGGWGGTVVGISSVDHSDASDNDTSTGKEFAPGRWYRIRVRVTEEKLEAWIDQEQVVELELKGRKLSLRDGEIEKSLPLGISAYQTRAAIRDIRLKRL